MQAIRKAPQSGDKALGFKVQAWKFVLIVELLMGDVPERKKFLVKEYRAYLNPYQEVTQAVRSGSLNEFERVTTKYKQLFTDDNTLSLVKRLHYNVIKTGLRSINMSYNRISMKDVCAKLGLESEQAAAGICGKAIADGVLNARVDYDKNELVCIGLKDVYSSSEPQSQLHKRIVFCLQLRNDCIKNMEYPAKKDPEDLADKDPTKDARELNEALAELSEDEDDIDML